MAGKSTPVLLVTANVGSIFEDPSQMLKIWTEEFLSTVAKLDPKFIALHCQEVGGKNYERSMQHVEDFVRLFMSSEELRLFDKVRVFLDEDYSSAENFTALGNFYFIHESLSDALIWDFAAMTFVPANGKEVHSGNIEAVTTKEKSKFPQDFFPECKWSRKGFLRTRWSLNGTVFDLINIHLFHDASNFIAMETYPSVYSKNRRRALEHTLERFHNDSYGIAPFFVFGDFNFRADTQGVINKLSDGLNAVRVQSNKSNDHTKLQYKDDASQIVLSLGKKEFSHADHQTVFFDESGMWLKEFDRELEAFGGRLFEFPISFPPSYPFEEDEKGGNNYMKTRCPAWCDRVLLSNTAKNLVNNISQSGSVEYGLIGPNTCMGDHKPVYLKMGLINDAGTVSCCTPCESSSSEKRVLCFGNVAVCETASWSCSSLSLKKSGSAPSALTLKLDTSAAALAADRFLAPPHASLLHEPYTPESMETPSSSPVPLRIQRDFGEIEAPDFKSGVDDEENGDDDHNGIFAPCNDINYTEVIKTSDHDSKASENIYVNTSENLEKNSETSVINYNDTSSQGIHNCIPHVLICYSDTQDKIFQNSKLERKIGLKVRHSEPNLSVKSILSHEETNMGKLFKPEQIQGDHRESSSQSSMVMTDVVGDKYSAISDELTPNEISEDYLISPRSENTCSPDSGILPSMSLSSSQSLNQTILKTLNSELYEIQDHVLPCKDSKLIEEKCFVSELSHQSVQKELLSKNIGTNYEKFKHKDCLGTSINKIKIDSLMADSAALNLSEEQNIEKCTVSLSNVDSENNIDLCVVPDSLNSKVHLCSKDVGSSKKIDLGINTNLETSEHLEKYQNIPPDSINFVYSENSSQDKKTKKQKYKNKKNTRRKSSHCCSIT